MGFTSPGIEENIPHSARIYSLEPFDVIKQKNLANKHVRFIDFKSADKLYWMSFSLALFLHYLINTLCSNAFDMFQLEV